MEKGTQKFNQLYGMLNKAQKEAVDTIEGPVMVLAGPGTGKTHILTLRIANILRLTDVDPENILALTFTDAGANNMRRRLAAIVGSVAYRVTISTFHSFCEKEVINVFPEYFPNIIGSRSIGQAEQIKLIEELVDNIPLKLLRPPGNPFYYIMKIKTAIEELKKDNIDEKEFKKLTEKEEKSLRRKTKETKAERLKKEKFHAKNKELLLVYQGYQKELKKRKWYDFTDMIGETVRALSRNKNLKLSLQEQYLYLLADEHQDANHAQNRVLELLADYHKDPNLFIVGDEKQAIYRFQGASLENFLYFKNRYPASITISLEKNYRSTQTILDAADSVIKYSTAGSAERKPLKSHLKNKELPISFYEFSSPETEEYFLALDIQKKIALGASPSEIAVIYRDNKDAFPIASMLEKVGVNFLVESKQDILEDKKIQKLLVIFRAVLNFGKDEHLVKLLHIDFLNLDPLEVYKVLSFPSGGRKSSVFETIRENPNFKKIYARLSGWNSKAFNQGLTETFEDIIRESGFLNHILSGKDIFEDMERLGALFSEAKEFVKRYPLAELKDFISHIDTLLEHNLGIKRKDAYSEGRVRLMTAHGAKGREFEYVYITGTHHGHWSSRRKVKHFNLPTGSLMDGGSQDDERRLFYVALTRAKKEVTISYFRKDGEGREKIASQFVKEISSKYIKTADEGPIEKEFAGRREVIFAPRQKTSHSLKDKEIVREIFSQRGFSVTALNNYLTCPWQYFYMNLLRVPSAKAPHQLFGTAVHAALAGFFKKFKKEGKKNKKALLALFEDKIVSQPLREEEKAAWLERGKVALGGFYDRYSKEWRTNSLVEARFKAPFSEEVLLTGNLDRIDFLSGEGDINVVDYKTGRPKSRNEILGKTKNSDGSIWRQIVFYKLLLEGAKARYRMVSGEIAFVEPTKAGSYKKEIFEVSDADVKELEGLIKKTTDEILGLKFWNKRCDDKKCEFCALREMMV